MPLYACEHCGFTSAAFRNDAAAAHRLGSPECDGVIRIIFRSEDRYRGATYPSSTASAPIATRITRQPPAEPSRAGRAFAIRDRRDADGALCLTLSGDLDLAVAETLSARLAELKATGGPVRLDLSKLSFIDSAGIQALLVALADARWTGWPLEVQREVSPSFERAARIVGIAEVLWPQDPPLDRASAAPPANTA